MNTKPNLPAEASQPNVFDRLTNASIPNISKLPADALLSRKQLCALTGFSEGSLQEVGARGPRPGADLRREPSPHSRRRLSGMDGRRAAGRLVNRRQRRASGRQKDGAELFRRAARRLIKGTTLSGTRPTGRYLVMQIRPMTVADMVPGHAYRPGLTLLEVQMPPTATQVGVEWQFPVMVPEGLREPTSDNARAVYAYVYGTDPEARRIIDELKTLARPWSEVLAAQGLPIEKLGPIVSASPGAVP